MATFHTKHFGYYSSCLGEDIIKKENVNIYVNGELRNDLIVSVDKGMIMLSEFVPVTGTNITYTVESRKVFDLNEYIMNKEYLSRYERRRLKHGNTINESGGFMRDEKFKHGNR